MNTFIIAEAGINHNGDIALAHKLIDAAHMTGADAVKFQCFHAARLEAPGERRDMLRPLEMTGEQFEALKKYCGTRIEFMATPFSLSWLDFLVSLGVKRLKISSGHLCDTRMLEAAGDTNLPIVLSTGMGDVDAIHEAVGALGFERPPDMESPFPTPGLRKGRLTLLHCTSSYPTPAEDVNLLAIDRMNARFGCPVGLSDHSLSTVIPVAAVARGATVIEKHITLDRSMKGPDHAASLEPHDFKRMVEGIREVEKAMGDGIKRPMPSEARTIDIIKERRSWNGRNIAA